MSSSRKQILNLDHSPARIPTFLQAGVGMSAKRVAFKKHLQKQIDSGGPLLLWLAQIVAHGQKNEPITLACNCKFKSFHSDVVAEIITDNRHLIEQVLPYFIPKEPEKQDDVVDAEVVSMSPQVVETGIVENA